MNKKLGVLVVLLLLPVLFSFVPMADATEDTFTSETLGGGINWYDVGEYPPEDAGDSEITDETEERIGQTYSTFIYFVFRMYVSFDTSSLPDDAQISDAELRLMTEEDHSTTDFTVRVYGGTQPIWGSTLEVADWGSGTMLCDSWASSDYSDEIYQNFTIPTDQINKEGRTQFEVVSHRELDDTTPTNDEYVDFYSADASSSKKPKLVITYTQESPSGGMKETVGDNWLFAGEWHDFVSTYTYGGTFDTVKLAFSDLYDANSLLLDGTDDSIDIVGDEIEPPVLEYLTISIWFKTDADTSGDVDDPILMTYAWAKSGYKLGIKNNKAYFALYGGANAYTNDVVNDDEWHYLVGIMNYSSWEYSCYLDGTLQISYTVPVAQQDKTAITGFRVGNEYGESTLYDGSVDQLTVFNRILSQSEIDYNQIHYKPKDRLDLVGLWHMDEGSGAVLYDASLYGNSGTINDATWQDGNVQSDPHWVITSYDVTNDVWALDSGSEIVTLQEGSTEQVGEDFIVTYSVFFKDTILDRLDVDIYAYSVNTTGTIDYWTEIATDYFNIYNLGGFATLETEGTAGRIAGGDIFDLYADGADAWVHVNQTYRKIQHVKLLAGFVIKNHADVGDVFVRYGIDFVDPTTHQFIRGWNVLINVTEINADTSNSYAVLEVRWYYNNLQIGTTDVMTAMWEDTAFATPDGEYDGVRFHLDLWFNKINGSSVVGGRVSPYMWGISKETLPWWNWRTWFGTEDWAAMRTNATESFLFTNLEDYTGTITTSKALDLTRLWCNLTNVGANDDIYVMNYRTFDYSFAPGGMEGINTPPFPETLDPNLPAGGGILAGLFSAIRGLAESFSKMLTTGVLSVWTTFVSFLDTVFSFAGWSNGFSLILEWISNFTTYLTNGVAYALSLMTSTFTLMADWLVLGIQEFARITTGLTVIYTQLNWIWTEVKASGLAMYEWIAPMLPLIPLAGFIWIFSARTLEGMIGRITMLWGLLSSVMGFLIHIGQFVIQIITGLIESIPVVE